jgi:hypothetical protein
MTPDTETGSPSLPDCGNATCAGEEFVSPGIGEGFIAFLRKAYAGYKPRCHARPRASVTFDTFIDAAPAEVKHIFVCVGCGGTFRMTQMNGRQKRCGPCGCEHKRQLLHDRYVARKAEAACQS